eukprot:2796543-Pyramimonas_sp.AAC.1
MADVADPTAARGACDQETRPGHLVGAPCADEIGLTLHIATSTMLFTASRGRPRNSSRTSPPRESQRNTIKRSTCLP